MGVILKMSSTSFFETRSLPGLELASLARLAEESQGSTVSTSPALGSQARAIMPGFFIWVLGAKLSTSCLGDEHFWSHPLASRVFFHALVREMCSLKTVGQHWAAALPLAKCVWSIDSFISLMDREQLQAGDGIYSSWSSSMSANYQPYCTISRKDRGVNGQTMSSN